MLRLFLFGPPRLEHHGQVVPLRRTKALALLAYLAMTRQPQDRETLLALLWPEFDDASARNNLRRELSLLKATLDAEILIADRLQVTWNPQVGLWLDVTAFQEQLAIRNQHPHASDELCSECAGALTMATQLYNNDFLAGFGVPDCAAFDEWQFFQREGLRQQLAHVLQSLIGWHSRQGEYGIGIAHARRWLALDPLHEPAQRQLMRLYTWSGQQSAALRQYEESVRLLDKELGIEPEAETAELYEAIRTRQIVASPHGTAMAELTAAPPNTGSLAEADPALAHSLPVVRNLLPHASPFVGRERELNEIIARLRDSTCRLLTLTGPGGIGKTLLSQVAAQAVAAEFTHGAYFVSLASIGDPQLIAQTILAALKIHMSGNTDPKAQLLTYLQAKHLLLLIDNFEHLLAGAELLSDIIVAAPRVSLLVTSRVRLNIYAEWSYLVSGMEYPGSEAEAPAGDGLAIEAYGAVQLFLTYACRAQATFRPRAADWPHIVRICRLLDGLPLGLELAALWIQSMNCREIADEIAQNLDFLSTSLHHVPERHRSLRAIYEQTWQRLSPAERNVLQQLSVFPGGCTRNAAEQVTGATLPILQTLASKALIRRSPSGRYDMHELVRQFAHTQLQSAPEEHQRLRERHCAYYAAFLQKRADSVRSGRSPEAVMEIDADIDNIRTAWHWAVTQQKMERIEQALECLWEFYKLRGAKEGAAVFQQALQARAAPGGAAETRGSSDKAVLGLLMVALGNLTARCGTLIEGHELMVRGIAHMRQAERRDARKEAVAVITLGAVCLMRGDYQAARKYAKATLPYFVGSDDLWGIASCLLQLGISAFEEGLLAEAEYFLHESAGACRRGGIRSERHIANNYLTRMALLQGQYAKVTQFIAENMAIAREIDLLYVKLSVLTQTSLLAIAQGSLEEAGAYVQQIIALRREHGLQSWDEFCLLGSVYRLQGQYDNAQELLLQSIAASQSVGDPTSVADCLAELGRLAAARADFAHAEQLHREALAIWQQQGYQSKMAAALSNIGDVLVAQGRARDEEVRRHYDEALRIAVQQRRVPLVLDVCVGVARLHMELGAGERAAELLSIALRHPASSYETKTRARQFASLVSAIRPAQSALSSVAAGASIDWQALVDRLIADIGSSGVAGNTTIPRDTPRTEAPVAL